MKTQIQEYDLAVLSYNLRDFSLPKTKFATIANNIAIVMLPLYRATNLK